MNYVVRRVPKDWKHPKDENNHYLPLYDGLQFSKKIARWDEGSQKWIDGFRRDFNDGNVWVPLSEKENGITYTAWCGDRPNEKDYTPLWQDGECTHFMLYEDISEGTPVSPVFSTIEEVHQWLETISRPLKFEELIEITGV